MRRKYQNIVVVKLWLSANLKEILSSAFGIENLFISGRNAEVTRCKNRGWNLFPYNTLQENQFLNSKKIKLHSYTDTYSFLLWMPGLNRDDYNFLRTVFKKIIRKFIIASK